MRTGDAARAALVAVGLGVPGVRADEPVDAVRMLPNAMVLPGWSAQVDLSATLSPQWPLLAGVEGDLRGVPGRRPGVAWASVNGAVRVDALRAAVGAPAAPPAYRLSLTPWRRVSQTAPIVAAQDVRVATLALTRDLPLAVRADAQLTALDWSGALYLPANHPGDIEARVGVGARVLGARWRRSDDAPSDFVGVSPGGLSGEAVYGRRFGRAFTLTAHLGARADWTLGARDGFTVLTDTAVWLGAVAELGPHDAVRLIAATRTTDDDDGPTAYAPELTLAWRSVW